VRLRVVGLGEVGKRVAAAAREAGHDVTEIDRQDVVDRNVTHDATFVCVGTCAENGAFDAAAIERALSNVAAALAPGELIAIESTVPPRWTATIAGPLIERISGAAIGYDVFLVAAPARTDRTLAPQVRTIPKLVGGVTPACTARGVEIYAQIVDRVIPVADATIAEAAKLLENAFRYVNVAFTNEIAELFATLGIEARSVVDAAATKPFGFMPFWPGVGIGGDCIPMAGSNLRELAQSAGVEDGILAAALASDATAPERTLRILQAMHGGRPSPLLIAGLTYKSMADSFAQSAGARLARHVAQAGLDVDVLEPHGDDQVTPLLGGARWVTRKTMRPRYEVAVIAAWQPEFRELVSEEIADTIVDLSGPPPEEGKGS